MSEEENVSEDANNDVRLEDGESLETGKDSQSESIQDDVQNDVDYESFAKVQGWSPKEKWRGNEAQWVDAETFVKRGQEFQSTLKKKSDNLERELREKKGKVHEDFKPAPVQQFEDPSIASFKAENQWYGVDPIMTDAANRYCQAQAKKGLSMADQLEETQKYMVKRFPEDFENPRRQAATTVSTAPAPSRAKKTRSLNELPAADQTMIKAAAKASNMDLKEYTKQYFEMENL